MLTATILAQRPVLQVDPTFRSHVTRVEDGRGLVLDILAGELRGVLRRLGCPRTGRPVRLQEVEFVLDESFFGVGGGLGHHGRDVLK